MITSLMVVENPIHPNRQSTALKFAQQQMKPWQFGIYGMPLSVERKYVSDSKNEKNIDSYTVNKVALEDLFYGLVTQTSPYVGAGGIWKYNDDSTLDTSSLVSGGEPDGHVTMMFKFSFDKITTNWMPLRMQGCGIIENIHPMIKSKHDAKDIISRVKSRILSKNCSMNQDLVHLFQFQVKENSIKKVSDRLIQRDLGNDSKIKGKVDGIYGCMCPTSPFGCVREITFPIGISHLGHILLIPGVNRGRKYGPLPGVQIKPDRRKACDFVHVLSRFHVLSKSINGVSVPVKSSSIRASSAHINDASLSNLWKSVSSILKQGNNDDPEIMENVFTSDAILSSIMVDKINVEHARNLGKHKEIDSAYSLETNINFMNSKGESVASNVLVTMAVIKANSSDSVDFPVNLVSDSPKLLEKLPYTSSQLIKKQKINRSFQKTQNIQSLAAWCKPFTSYMLHKSLTPVVTNDANNGSLWAKAFLAFVNGDRENAVKTCKEIADIIDSSTNSTEKHVEKLKTMIQDKNNCASILHVVSRKYGVGDIIPVISRDFETFM